MRCYDGGPFVTFLLSMIVVHYFHRLFSSANYLVLTFRDALSHGGVERAIVQNVVLGLEETTWI